MIKDVSSKTSKGKMLEGKRILVTGGTGSMGKTFIRRLLSGEHGNPEKVVVMSRDEGKQHDMRLEFMNMDEQTHEVAYNNFRRALAFRIGDVRNYDDVSAAVRDMDIVINAAALKQVPICEYFPHQAVLTNCIGAENITRACAEAKCTVETVVGISTDKAVHPINVMGMTKSLQERIFIAGNLQDNDTRYVCVRYGNVLASRGSVIPLFLQLIENNRPLTLTHKDMTRFLISLDQAVDTVFAALANAKPGEIFVPDAPSATMENVAKAMIGSRNLEIKVIGIRPGEKMHEIMVSEEEAWRVRRAGDFYAVAPMLPELVPDMSVYANSPLTKEFSSGDTVLNFQQTVDLLAKHSLLPGMDNKQGLSEILR